MSSAEGRFRVGWTSEKGFVESRVGHSVVGIFEHREGAGGKAQQANHQLHMVCVGKEHVF